MSPGAFHYALEISYDGAGFSGWQSQPGRMGVQDSVEGALVDLAEPRCDWVSRAKVTGAGRTDAGVHARAQVADVWLSKKWEPRRLVLALNAKLPPSISVMRASWASEGFHARRSALSREYHYFIWNSSTCYPHIRPYVLWRPGDHFDWARAAGAAKILEGTHDFRSFCRKEDCPERTERTVARSRLSMRGPLLVLCVEANAFLTNMVRIMAGNLLEIASGRRDEAWLAGLLSGDVDRAASAATLPPAGLFLWRVRYP
ncbi:MAG: tRNA pseudouridine(38-40) synthase TruA, partial [Synergistaceae bacterium]|nr:tRNA pseudouridine(38-40) synthase TruA [Synergistaceae bacterium]